MKKTELTQAQIEARALTKELKKTPARKSLEKAYHETTKSVNDVVRFVSFLVKFTFACGVLYCGIYAAYKGVNSTYLLAHFGLIVAGAVTTVNGVALMYRAVLEK